MWAKVPGPEIVRLCMAVPVLAGDSFWVSSNNMKKITQQLLARSAFIDGIKTRKKPSVKLTKPDGSL